MTPFRILLAACLLLSTPAAASDPSYLGAPGVLTLDGVGAIYGGAAAAKNVFKEGTTLGAAAALGAVRGGGLVLQGLPVFDGRAKLTTGFGLLNRAEFTTQYGRAYNQGFLVEQVIDGFGFGARLDYERIPERLSLHASLVFSSIGFVEYKNRAGSTIPISRKDLKDVTSNAITFGARYKPLEDERLKIDASMTTLAGRPAQSDLELFRVKFSGTQKRRSFRLSYGTKINAALVIRDAGPGAADLQCTAITDPALKSDCNKLQTQVNDFIVKSNSAGTTAPLGGSNGLRSYREMRFKAANTALSGIEFGWSPLSEYPVELLAFYELGHAADDLGSLYSRARYSIGTGVRVNLKGLPIRAEFAHGQEDSAAFLTIGSVW